MRNAYIIQPPSVPMFLYKNHPSNLRNLIEWAKKEHNARLRYCAEHGYFRELKRLNEDYSYLRVLAEIKGFRKICATISQNAWNELSGRDRVSIRRAYEFRELLF